jgi:hypothetical protein
VVPEGVRDTERDDESIVTDAIGELEGVQDAVREGVTLFDGGELRENDEEGLYCVELTDTSRDPELVRVGESIEDADSDTETVLEVLLLVDLDGATDKDELTLALVSIVQLLDGDTELLCDEDSLELWVAETSGLQLEVVVGSFVAVGVLLGDPLSVTVRVGDADVVGLPVTDGEMLSLERSLSVGDSLFEEATLSVATLIENDSV